MSLDISGQVGCQQGAALSVHSLVYTDSHTLPPSLASVTICSVGAGAEEYEDIEKL